MNLSGRALFDNALDQQLYVERAESERITGNIRSQMNTAVIGERGAGKTTLLRHIAYECREAGRSSLFVDASLVTEAADLVDALIAEFTRNPKMAPPASGALIHERDSSSGEVGALISRLRVLGQLVDDLNRRVPVFVDSLVDGETISAVFGRMRDEIWQLPFTWVVALDSSLRASLRIPPADAFFEDVVELRPLTLQQQIKLVEKRFEGEDEITPWRVPQPGEDNPRQLLEIVRDSFRRRVTPEDASQAHVIRRMRVDLLGSTAARVYAELATNGAASASDEALLHRVGISRQRAAQVLAKLEQAGFVSSSTKQGATGRPRKVFEATEVPIG